MPNALTLGDRSPRLRKVVGRESPRVTSTEEPDGGNLLVRIWRGAGVGNLPAYSTTTDRKFKRSFGATPAAAPAPASPTGRPTVRTALPSRPERRGCLARAPRSQAEHGAAWRWLGLDRRRRRGEGSAQGWLAGVPRRARLAPPDRAPG